MNRISIKNLGRLGKVLKSYLLIAIIFAIIASDINSHASLNIKVPEYIRVGLTEYYSNKSEISFSNSNIEIGYNEKDFNAIAKLKSSNGFKVRNNSGYRVLIDETYKNYEEAVSRINGTKGLIPIIYDDGDVRITSKLFSTESELESFKDTLYDSYSYVKTLTNTNKQIVLLTTTNDELMLFEGTNSPLIKSADSDTVKVMKFNERHYRDYIRFIRNDNITAVNVIGFDRYLYSVTPSEMPASWSLEALKAQAVSARTYLLKRVEAKAYNGYDITDTVNDQAYKGYKVEHVNSTKAVDETSGVVVAYDGKMIETYYSSTSGGVTEESQNVWSASLPYLKSKKDIYEAENQHYNWEITFTLSDIEAALSKTGESVGTVKNVRIEKSPISGRVLNLIIEGTKGTKTITKEPIRTFFRNVKNSGVSLKSRYFELIQPHEETTEYSTIYVIGADGKVVERTSKDLYAATYSETKKLEGMSISFLGSGEVVSKKMQEVVTKVTDSNSYTVIGSGYGHGVGMSQYGAKGMAEAGFNYEEIIKFYYTGVELYKLEN